MPPGVSFRNDCPRIPAVIEPNCQPRTPTAMPPGGAQQTSTQDPTTAAQVLCSAVPDAAIRSILNGPFLIYTNPQGECHLNRTALHEPEHSIALTSTLSPLPVASFRSHDYSSWHPFRVGSLTAGYIQVWNNVRWYRVGVTPDPDAPGTLLVACRYITFAGPNTTQTIPAPPQFWTSTDNYVRQLATRITR